MLDHVLLHILNIETVGVVDGGVVLDDSGDLAAVLLDELGSPVAHSAEALHDEGLACDAGGETAALSEGLGVEHLAHGVVDTETGGLGTTSDTTLRDKFASAAALSIDISLTLHIDVGVLDPGHGLLVGSHIGAEAINLSTNEALLDELHSVLAGCSLNLSLRVLSWVKLDSTLGSSERHISDGQLEGHE